MKLNTKLGVGKQQDMKLVLDGPLEVVLRQDNTRLDALEGRISELISALAKPTAAPDGAAAAQEPVAPKPASFSLDIRRREDGLINEVKARDSSTGLLYFTFSIQRDGHGSVTNVMAVPR